MNTRWCHCGSSGSREWLLGHLRSTTGEGGGGRRRGGGGWTEPMSSVCGEHDLTHHSGGGEGKQYCVLFCFFNLLINVAANTTSKEKLIKRQRTSVLLNH